jgi:hypothetical protein
MFSEALVIMVPMVLMILVVLAMVSSWYQGFSFGVSVGCIKVSSLGVGVSEVVKLSSIVESKFQGIGVLFIMVSQCRGIRCCRVKVSRYQFVVVSRCWSAL